MKTKILWIAIAYYAAAGLSGCVRCKCDDNPNRNFIYAELQSAVNSCVLSDSTFQFMALTSDSLPKEQLGIQLNLNGTIVFSEPETKHMPGFINTAYACSCPETMYFTADSISSIKIITLNNFDSTHVAGSDVTGYFRVPEYDYSGGKAKVIQKPMEDYFQYSYSGPGPGFYLNIYLNRFPQNEGYAKFKIRVFTVNGKVFENETEAIYLY